MFDQIKKWAMQPTTVAGLMALASSAAAHWAGGAPPWVIASLVAGGLAGLIFPDHTAAARPIEKLAADAVQAAMLGRLAQMAPTLFGDAAQVIQAVVPAPAPTPSPAPVVQPAAAPAPQSGQPA